MMSEDADVTPRCSTKQVIIVHRVPVIALGDWLLVLSITARRLDVWYQHVPPTSVYQPVPLTSVFGNSHVPQLYLLLLP